MFLPLNPLLLCPDFFPVSSGAVLAFFDDDLFEGVSPPNNMWSFHEETRSSRLMTDRLR